MGLPEALVAALVAQGKPAPFAIQTVTIPDSLAGRDVLGRAQTGSGKTLAFGLPMLAKLAGARSTPRNPRGLVLVPTRELASQVTAELEPLAKALGLRIGTVVGGVNIGRQVSQLADGIDLLVATPGRLADHVQQRTAGLQDVVITALDEADHMADMGFLPQVTKLLDKTPRGQRLLFSATLDGEVDKLVKRYMTNPVTHSTAPPSASVTTMEHHLLMIDPDDKKNVVAHIAAREGRTIMFVRTKHGVDRLAKQLRATGAMTGALHGGKAQNNRTRTLDAFKDGTTPVLVATDVAARGIHVDDVSLVVHVDPPADPKDYLHRAGRTARAGDQGIVVTLVTHPERREVEAMTRKAGVKAISTPVRAGDTDLARITGARSPSGTPVMAPAPPQQQVSRAGGRRGGVGGGAAAPRRSGSGQARRGGSAGGGGGQRRSQGR
ncbi:DEAD/DEAH box helicase [Rhodococcus sp. X156]|uniref:DEAD/DEAH box helicase n=1 Tax=Rhodococcus sp. X156 TaxID=2499145 RepID=UPI001F49CCD0|nr:DEAD/DEAH box helicase [Rhodococcus sp. X156]